MAKPDKNERLNDFNSRLMLYTGFMIAVVLFVLNSKSNYKLSDAVSRIEQRQSQIDSLRLKYHELELKYRLQIQKCEGIRERDSLRYFNLNIKTNHYNLPNRIEHGLKPLRKTSIFKIFEKTKQVPDSLRGKYLDKFDHRFQEVLSQEPFNTSPNTDYSPKLKHATALKSAYTKSHILGSSYFENCYYDVDYVVGDNTVQCRIILNGTYAVGYNGKYGEMGDKMFEEYTKALAVAIQKCSKILCPEFRGVVENTSCNCK